MDLTNRLDVVNTFLNGATIMTFVAYFWWQNQRGNIITRRENTSTLSIKDEVIAELRQANRDKDEVIREQARQLAVALESAETFRHFIEVAKNKVTGEGDIPHV